MLPCKARNELCMFAFHQLVCKLFKALLICLAIMHWNRFNVMAALALCFAKPA